VRRIALSLLFTALFLLPISAKEKTPRAYPEHGMVTAIHLGEHQRSLPIHTDSQGKTGGGQIVHARTQTYTVETDSLTFEFSEESKRPTSDIDQKIDFRLEKDRCYVAPNGRERRYDVTGRERKRTATDAATH
jgi:hypothetical protein